MTGQEIKELTTEILRGFEMDDTTFYTILNLWKNHIEAMRPWRKLITEDSSKTWSPSDTYATTKALPTGFVMAAPRRPMTLLSSGGSSMQLEQAPLIDRIMKKDNNGLFVVDMKNLTFSILGTVDQTYTVHLFHTVYSDDITASTEWDFPARYHPLLAFGVSAIQKGGIDYDDVFARMAPENRGLAELLMQDMENWDDALQRAELGNR